MLNYITKSAGVCIEVWWLGVSKTGQVKCSIRNAHVGWVAGDGIG